METLRKGLPQTVFAMMACPLWQARVSRHSFYVRNYTNGCRGRLTSRKRLIYARNAALSIYWA